MSISRVLIQTLVISFAVFSLHTDASETEAIPPELSEWIPWVLRDQPDYHCPRIEIGRAHV